jgi:hypothetical protein
MNAEQVIVAMGGRAKVIELTGLSKGRISQWVTDNSIPKAWMRLFHEKRPDVIPRELPVTEDL